MRPEHREVGLEGCVCVGGGGIGEPDESQNFVCVHVFSF